MEITWQGGRLGDKYSKSHPDADSHPKAESFQEGNLHPEADAHPEVNALELAEADSHPEAKVHQTASTRARLHNVQKCQLLFRSLLCRVNLRQSQPCSLKVWKAFFKMRQNWRHCQIQIWRPH